MKKFFKNRMFVSVFLSVSVAFIFVFVAVQAATTISTAISTGGALTVTGETNLNGGLKMDTSLFTVADGSGNTSIAGTLAVTGLTIITGQFQASSTSLFGNTVGIIGAVDILGAASSSSLVVQGAASTTSLRVGGGSLVSRFLFGSCTVDLPSITGTTTEVDANCTATGVTTGFKVFVTPCGSSSPNGTGGIAGAGIVLSSASATANNIIQVAAYAVGTSTPFNPGPADCWAWMAGQ